MNRQIAKSTPVRTIYENDASDVQDHAAYTIMPTRITVPSILIGINVMNLHQDDTRIK